MLQRFVPSLFDKLIDPGPPASWSMEQLKDAVARDLEALLNTRAALAPELLEPYPAVADSVLNYGLIDFASMCLSSDADRARICAAVRSTIERHESRLHSVEATLRIHAGQVNRVDFVISATLIADASSAPVQFDAVLEPSSQQYQIRRVQRARSLGAL